MLFELLIQSFISALALGLAILLIASKKYWKMLLGIVLLAVGLFFAMNTGEFLMWFLGYVPEFGLVKATLAFFFPYVVGVSFIAWLAYVSIAYLSRLKVLPVLWNAYISKQPPRHDHFEAAKRNALRDQFLWLMVSFVVSITALAITVLIWTHMDLIYQNAEVMLVAIAWVFVFPPLVIHAGLKKPAAVLAIKELKDLHSIKSEKLSGYRELIAAMDEIKDEELKAQLDNLIIDGLAKNITENR